MKPIKKIDMEQLVLTDELRDQMELKLSILTKLVSTISKGTFMVRDQEMFKVFKLAEITFGTQDLNVLETYMEHQRQGHDNLIGFKMFCDHFRLDPLTSECLADIVQ